LNEKDEFRWVMSEQLTVIEWATIITGLAPFFDFDVNEIIEKLGLTVELKQQIEAIKPTIEQKVKNEYKHILNSK